MNIKSYSPTNVGTRKLRWAFYLLLFLFLPSMMQANDEVFAQTTITASFRNTNLNDVLWEIQKQSNFKFIYSTNEIDKVTVEDLNVENEEIASVLNKCLANSGLTYTVHNGVIAIKPEPLKVVTPEVRAPKSVKIRGIILDELGEPAIGANIVVKGTTNGTITFMDGRFELEVPELPVTLIVSYIGYVKQEIKVTTTQDIKVDLVSDANMMDEVVVTGYGTFKKSAYAGSAATVKTAELQDVPAVDFRDLLQGSASGVQISSTSGQPGASSSVSIRGMGSFNASNSPLYVIDGIPVRSGTINSMSSDAGLDIMSTINSSDIETITVIKDAAAASLYGSRAANGVILITTKKGKEGKATVSVKADWGFSDFAMEYRPVMNGADRRDYIYNGLAAGQMRDGATEADALAYADANIDKYAPIPWCGFIDWDDIMFQKGSHQTYEASVSGGTDKFKYYSSLSYLKQDGISLNSGMNRISGRMNIDYQATSRLRIGANVLMAIVNQDVYSEGTSYTAPFYSSRNCVVPSDAVYNEDGSWNREFIRNGKRNPLLAATYDYQKENVHRTMNTVFAEYEFIKNLKLKSTLSYDYTVTKGTDWSDPRTSNGESTNGAMDKKFYEFSKLVWATAATYQKTISDKHTIDVLAGYEIDATYRDYLSGSVTNFVTADKNDVSNGQTVGSVGGNSTEYRMISYLTRANYDYMSKYYLGASFRIDGSSRLARGNRWGKFWSASAAWRVIEEDFMEALKDNMSDLKLRASYGVNGTLPSDYYGYMGLSSVSDGYLEQPGIIQSQIANSDLQWETNHNFNIGLDFGFWNRLNFTIEYYTRTTKNLLMDCPISMTTGFGSYLMNIGKVRNKGFELEINSTNIENKNFRWNTTFNISHNRNEILVLDGEQTRIISGTQIREVGKSYRTFYMIEFAGINPETGAPQFYTNSVDENGNLVKDITENSSEANAIVLDKQAEPKVVGGLSNTLRYKWFDLNFTFTYQFGGYSYDNWAQKTEHGGNDMEANIPTYYKDSWKQPGDVTQYEIFIASPSNAMNKITTTRRLHSSDFVRLKNLTFGVTLPKQLTQKAGINNLRFYMSANNLWIWAKHDYYDPEAVRNGSAIWGTPPLKTVTFGLNMNF